MTYSYDRASNRLSRDVMPIDGSADTVTGHDFEYAYDGLHRLTQAKRGSLEDGTFSNLNRQADWTLEQSGNWSAYDIDGNGDGDTDGGAGEGDLEQTRTHNDANETTGISGGSWVLPAHDKAGNMTLAPNPGSEDATADNDGRLCVYDAWNRLVKVYKDNDSDGELDDPGDDLIVEYRYDARHRRIVKLLRVDNGEDPDTWNRTDYYYTNAWQVLSEYFAADLPTSSEEDPDKDDVVTDVKYQYVWGIRYVDAPICRDEDVNADDDCVDAKDNVLRASNDGDEHLYYTQDANFNVTALVDAYDASEEDFGTGDVVERYEYDPYGQVTVLHGVRNRAGTATTEWNARTTAADQFENELLYAAYRHDPETGFYHVRYRMYHPTLGRFMQRDPAGYIDGMSLYEYVMADPIGLLDPYGLDVLEKDPYGLTAKEPTALAKALALVKQHAPEAYKFLIDCEIEIKTFELDPAADPESREEVGRTKSVGDKISIEVATGRVEKMATAIVHEVVHARVKKAVCEATKKMAEVQERVDEATKDGGKPSPELQAERDAAFNACVALAPTTKFRRNKETDAHIAHKKFERAMAGDADKRTDEDIRKEAEKDVHENYPKLRKDNKGGGGAKGPPDTPKAADP